MCLLRTIIQECAEDIAHIAKYIGSTFVGVTGTRTPDECDAETENAIVASCDVARNAVHRVSVTDWSRLGERFFRH
jgi:hypothetical protein